MSAKHVSPAGILRSIVNTARPVPFFSLRRKNEKKKNLGIVPEVVLAVNFFRLRKPHQESKRVVPIAELTKK